MQTDAYFLTICGVKICFLLLYPLWSMEFINGYQPSSNLKLKSVTHYLPFMNLKSLIHCALHKTLATINNSTIYITFA